MRISDWSSDVCSSDLHGELARALVLQRPYRDHRKAVVDLGRGHRVTGLAADDRLLELRVRDGFARADESRTELAAGRAHFEIGDEGLAATAAAGDEDRPHPDHGQALRGQDARRYRAEIPPRPEAF